MTAIDDRLAELRAAGVELGEPLDDEVALGDGRMLRLAGGSLFDAPGIGVVVLDADITAKYLAMGGPAGLFGWPTADTADSPGGRFSTFQFQGAIIVSGSRGVFEAHGLIGELYQSFGGPHGPLGAPTSDETVAGEGRISNFEEIGSGIWWTQDTGPQLIRDFAADSAASMAAEQAGLLGASISEIVVDELNLHPDHICLPVSAELDAIVAGQFGMLAESVIVADYIAQMSGGVLNPAVDFFDLKGWAVNYYQFLTAHHPGLPVTRKLVATFKRPDILTDAPGRQEWYEIKPRTPSGIADGLVKLFEIPVFMDICGLPYRPGRAYTPTAEIHLADFDIHGVRVEAYLCVERARPGLITYRLGLRGNLIEALQRIRFAVMVMIIVAGLLAGLRGIKIEMPPGLEPAPIVA